MDLRLDDRVAFITGADSGIGQGIAKAFAESGADVAINYRTDKAGAERTAALVGATGRRALVLQGDVGDPLLVERMFGEIDDVFGHIEIMVNNAGVGGGEDITRLTMNDWTRVLATNMTGTMLCAQQAIRRMIDRGTRHGRVINITSVHEEACGNGNIAYNATKAGIRNLTRTVASHVGPQGITVNNIAPGMILTPMNGRALEDKAYLDEAEAQIPLRRAGLPADVANMATFLASDAASYCTGATYYVDGGWMLTQPFV